jgi:hypothetical protein
VSSNSVRDFLSWFDGVCAFMGDDVPTEDQWEKIKARVEALREMTAAAPQQETTEATTAAAAKLKPKTWTDKAWRDGFAEGCLDNGLDEETGWSVFGGRPIDHQRDPREVAAEIAREALGSH